MFLIIKNCIYLCSINLNKNIDRIHSLSMLQHSVRPNATAMDSRHMKISGLDVVTFGKFPSVGYEN